MDDFFVILLAFLPSVDDMISLSRALALEPRPSFFSLLFFLISLSRLDYEISRNVSGSPQTDLLSGLPLLSYRTRNWFRITNEIMYNSSMAERYVKSLTGIQLQLSSRWN